jgi:HD-GYP domain-containing protein (c-di-GMP phosphodiesterase class II)
LTRQPKVALIERCNAGEPFNGAAGQEWLAMVPRLRLADLLAGLSVLVDLGYGLPMETAMRSCIVGTALARKVGLSEREASDVFYVSLLLHVGCLAYSHETAAAFGDDAAVHRAVVRTTTPTEVLSVLIPEATRGLPPRARVRSVVSLAATGSAFAKRHDIASCEAARAVARRIGLSENVSTALHDVHEWWNGRGARHRKGDQIALAARVARVATEAVFLAAITDADSALPTLRRFAGRRLDPEVTGVFSANAPALYAEASSGDPRMTVLEIEPASHVEVDATGLAAVAAAFGDLIDVKTPYTHGHSGETARLSVLAATRLGLDSEAVAQLHVAALLHDVGRAGVSNAVWEKPAPLTTAEWEQVRMHPYFTERILATSATLAPMAAVAGLHHERLDGSGYHRGCGAPSISTAARVLAAADAFHAMTQHRPHRRALQAAAVRDELLREVRQGRLDADAVAAVLDAAGQPPPARRVDVRPAGLTEREVEVLRLVAEGHSNPEIGRRLDVSRRTAEHHVQHIYTKIGASSRAAAALFALEHGLLPGQARL